MLVLHAAWLAAEGEREAGLLIWGETDRIAGRRTRSGSPPALPFAASINALREAITGTGVEAAAAAVDGEAIGCLPSAGGEPLPSPLLGSGPKAEGHDAVELAPYRVRGLQFRPADAVAALAALLPERLTGDTALGDDVRFWQQAGLFALSLLARQRFMPALAIVDARFEARWRPLAGEGEDAARLTALAAAMPPAARALTRQAEMHVSGPRTLLRSFLDTSVDALARRAVAGSVRAVADATPADAWLAALCGRPVLAGRPAELGTFRHVFQAWSRPAGAARGEAPFRLCFRLEPPAAADYSIAAGAAGRTAIWTVDGPAKRVADSGQTELPWRLSYHLQATDDPSLLVPAADVWQVRGSTARFLDRRFEQPQERVLAALGHAARLFPPVERSLRTQRPDAADLSTEEAYSLVRDAGPLLAESGYGVLLPGMENRIGLRMKLSSPSAPGASSAGPATFGWENVVNFDWEVAIGGETISRAEFEALVRLKAPLVQVRGQWVELRPELVEKALALLQRHPPGDELSLGEALRLALAPAADPSLEVLPVESVQAEGAFRQVLDELRDGAAREELAEPERFEGSLRPYQKTGVSWLATLSRFGLGACLADDMGLGKTVQLIALLLHRRRNGAPAAPALLICPTSVAANWRRELEKFAPTLRVLVHHGVARNREELAAEAAKHDVVISTYALLHRDAEVLTGIHWDEVVLDEAQNIKNPGTKGAQTARALDARWRAALTSTPVENRLTDLWSIFQFLNPGLLGGVTEFRRGFALPIERTQDQRAAARLQQLVGPFILRRLKSDKSIIADLPEKNEMKVFCTLTREQATLYQAVLKESLEDIEEDEGIRRRGQILAILTKLKQVCDHPALLLHDGSRLTGRSGKLARLTEMLEEVVSEGDRALVFTQYAEMGGLLVELLQAALGREVLFLHGGTSVPARERMVARFQAEGHGPQIFVLSIKAGGTGLNLTRANHVFHFDRWWNPAVENQATDRAFRIGQRRDVQVHKYICDGTFEETLDALIERKLALAEAITGTSESWITELSTAELRDLFRLRAEAVVSESETESLAGARR